MSIESIIKRIEDEAKAYGKDVKAKATSEKKAILADARIEADKIKAEAEARADKESKLLVERRESVAGLESRKMKLQAKQEVIAESFEEAFKKLLNMDEAAYLDFFKNQLAAFEKDGGEVLLNAADNKKYGAKVKKLLGKNLTLSDEAANIKGGFILKQGDISINCSLEKLLEDKKEEMTSEIAAKLFPNA